MSWHLTALVVFSCLELTPAPITSNARLLTKEEQYRARVAKNKKMKEEADMMKRKAEEKYHAMWSEQSHELGSKVERMIWEDKHRKRTGKDPELTIENMTPEGRILMQQQLAQMTHKTGDHDKIHNHPHWNLKSMLPEGARNPARHSLDL
eukprot:gnl/MRDRNA2_/MRDRNA2_93653_c0_seq1.p1 gnl/MRDRNA2_/MRDRNA2_93653_c0~~gnl/MRDRNA2_/MRDRNA2_93653_c0_seq1.p1  ORF type:complete len:150 (+),score=36.22 gnl/MRDRNA2_/MRDRNA2_93653_c0_seq1:100-549(+)